MWTCRGTPTLKKRQHPIEFIRFSDRRLCGTSVLNYSQSSNHSKYPHFFSLFSPVETTARLLDAHRVALSVENKLVQTNNISLGEGEVEILEDLSEVEAANIHQ